MLQLALVIMIVAVFIILGLTNAIILVPIGIVLGILGIALFLYTGLMRHR